MAAYPELIIGIMVGAGSIVFLIKKGLLNIEKTLEVKEVD